MKWVHRLFLTLTLAPIAIWATLFVVMLAIGFGLGCHITEGPLRPCLFLGRDIGPAAQQIGVLVAWAPLIVGPMMLASATAWGAVTLAAKLWRRFR